MAVFLIPRREVNGQIADSSMMACQSQCEVSCFVAGPDKVEQSRGALRLFRQNLGIMPAGRITSIQGNMAPTIVFLLLASAVAFTFLPAFVLWLYAGMSVLTFVVYAFDKSAARNRQPRTRERTLHGLAVCCGWPGAMLAQQLLRHKSSKRSFLTVFWLTFAANVTVLAYVLSPYGAWLRLSVRV